MIATCLAGRDVSPPRFLAPRSVRSGTSAPSVPRRALASALNASSITRQTQRNIRVRLWKLSPSDPGYPDQRHKACLFPVTQQTSRDAVTWKRISPTVAAGEQIARTMDRGGDIRWPEIRRVRAPCLNPFPTTQTPLIPSEVEGRADGWACPSTSLGMSGVGCGSRASWLRWHAPTIGCRGHPCPPEAPHTSPLHHAARAATSAA